MAGGGVHIRTPQPAALAEAFQRAGYASSPEGADGLVVRGATPEVVGPLVAAAGIVVHELRPHVPDLEAAFLALTERTSGGRS
jgi:ABC-2 type transport system ATP-binding protein